MKKRSIPTAVALAMILPFSVPAHLGAQIDELAVGIRQVQEGDLDAAVITLDTVIQRLSKVKGAEKDVATAHLYLGMAHLGLSQWERAKAEMREAWRNNKDLRLDPQSFSPRVRQMFDDAKREAATAESATKQSDEQTAVNPGTNPQPPPVAKKGGSKALFIVGGVAITGGATAAMAGGGGYSGDTCPGNTSGNTCPSTPSHCIRHLAFSPRVRHLGRRVSCHPIAPDFFRRNSPNHRQLDLCHEPIHTVLDIVSLLWRHQSAAEY